jgi:hypothetical protein
MDVPVLRGVPVRENAAVGRPVGEDAATRPGGCGLLAQLVAAGVSAMSGGGGRPFQPPAPARRRWLVGRASSGRLRLARLDAIAAIGPLEQRHRVGHHVLARRDSDHGKAGHSDRRRADPQRPPPRRPTAPPSCRRRRAAASRPRRPPRTRSPAPRRRTRRRPRGPCCLRRWLPATRGGGGGGSTFNRHRGVNFGPSLTAKAESYTVRPPECPHSHAQSPPRPWCAASDSTCAASGNACPGNAETARGLTLVLSLAGLVSWSNACGITRSRAAALGWMPLLGEEPG